MLTEADLDDLFEDDLRYREEMNKQHTAWVNAQMEEPPDPRIAIYYGSDPAAFVAQCCERPGDPRRLTFAKAIIQLCCGSSYRGNIDELKPYSFGAWISVRWENVLANTALWPYAPIDDPRCQLLRSCFAPPWLCGEATCDHHAATADDGCADCHGTGIIRTPPPFDMRWRMLAVLDLAREVRGGDKTAPGIIGAIGGRYKPRYDRFPYLAMALEDAGCDCREIIEHCMSGGPWVRGDWLVGLVLGG